MMMKNDRKSHGRRPILSIVEVVATSAYQTHCNGNTASQLAVTLCAMHRPLKALLILVALCLLLFFSVIGYFSVGHYWT